MKKIALIILGLALAGGLVYFFNQPKTDETKTVGQPEEFMETANLTPDNSLTTIDSELQATEFNDFDQEIQALDKSINQL